MPYEAKIIIFRLADTLGAKIASARLAGLVSQGYEVVGSGAGNKRGFLALVKCVPDEADSEDDHKAACCERDTWPPKTPWAPGR